jgi:hypothetical protein
MEQLLGYTAHSASTLTDEQIEDETLHWAVDTHVIGIDDDKEVDQRSSKDETYSSKQTYKYDSLSDLIVASRFTTVTQSMALLWQLLSTLFDKAEKKTRMIPPYFGSSFTNAILCGTTIPWSNSCKPFPFPNPNYPST